MRIVRVDREQTEYFRAVAPGAVLANVGTRHCSALGAMMGKKAVGIIVFSWQSKKMPVIEWFNVDEDYQGKRIGAQLLEMMFMIGKNMNANYICVRAGMDEMPSDMQEYLDLWGFEWVNNALEYGYDLPDSYAMPYTMQAPVSAIDKLYEQNAAIIGGRAC